MLLWTAGSVPAAAGSKEPADHSVLTAANVDSITNAALAAANVDSVDNAGKTADDSGKTGDSKQKEAVEQAIRKAVLWAQGEEKTVFSEDVVNAAGDSYSDWLAFDVGRLGVEKERYETYLEALESYVTKAYATDSLLDDNKATEWHRISLTVKALGGDPTAFGTDPSGNPINLIADGTYNRGKRVELGRQGNNAYIWALLTLDSGNYQVPADAVDTRETIVDQILKSQEKDGAFTLMEGSPDIDITCMAVQALAPYYDRTEEAYVNVKPAVDRALAWVSGVQLENGGLASYGTESSESMSQLIVALCSLGRDPFTQEDFIKNGKSPVDVLLGYQLEDGGFYHAEASKGADLMATEQALYALTAVYRLQNGYNSLYDIEKEADGASTIAFPMETSKEGGSWKLYAGIAAVVLVALALAGIFLKKKKKPVLLVLLALNLCLLGGCQQIGSTASVAGQKTEATVADTVAKGDKKSTKEAGSCTLEVECSTILKNMQDLTKGKETLVPEDGIIYPRQTVTFYEGESVYDVLLREMQKNRIHMDFQYTKVYDSVYIKGINNLYEMDCGRWSGWMYCVNGEYPNYGCSSYALKDGDVVEWHYTCDLGRDLGQTVPDMEDAGSGNSGETEKAGSGNNGQTEKAGSGNNGKTTEADSGNSGETGS